MNVLVNIDVDDLERGISFYENGLGLTLVRRLFDGSVAEMTGAGTQIYLLENEAGAIAAAGVTRYRTYERHWTPIHLDFEVEDLPKARDQAVAAGARQETEIREFA